ncbi:MAG: AraC family transcriptional regulator [Myxococcales bacterium]|nr:AraC family transcriptional regulator [Myxococcales bacterium]
MDYVDRINRVIDHVMQHLDRPLRLEELAKVACLSRFHFHRIFKRAMGETLLQFVARVRLERALHLLAHGRPLSMTEVALRCGFSSSSDFTRRFKQHYGAPPSRFDPDALRRLRRQQLERSVDPGDGRLHFPRLPAGENPDGFEVVRKSLPTRIVAYRCVHRPYEGHGVLDAAAQLEAWAEARGWADGQWLGYQWEDPEIVHVDQCRYYVAVVVPERFHDDGPVGCHTFAAMQVASLSMDGPIELEMRALDWLYGTWLPDSGTVPDDQPSFEAWHARPFADGHTRFRLELHLPVVPSPS